MTAKPGRKDAYSVLTANRLTDGVVVYRSADGAWVEDLSASRIFADKAAAEAALAEGLEDVVRRIVAGPYLFDVAARLDAVIPLSVRERIRSAGPTVRTDLGKQADRAAATLELAAAAA